MKEKLKFWFVKLKHEHAIGGFVAFSIVFITLALFIAKYDNNGSSWFNSLVTISDFVTSLLLVFSLIVAFGIYLTNRNIIPANMIIEAIHKMPEYIPFKHTMEEYLIPLIKKKHKIIILLNDVDKENYQSIASQIVAYDDYVNNVHKKFFKDITEFYLVDKDEKNEETFRDFFVRECRVEYFDYIVIASVSSIFSSAIIARDKMDDCYKRSIKIIGTLTSISKNISRYVNKDNDIIRVFPPDYDEAKSAMQFLLARLHNRVCSNSNCSFMLERTNVIVLYNRTYGNAVAKQSKYFFDKEIENYEITMPSSLKNAKKVTPNINFISAEFNINESHLKINSKDTTLQDLPKDAILENITDKLRGAKNYFYIVGYEPNITKMLLRLNNIIDSKCQHNILICGTATMHYWRETIVNTLKNCDNLNKDAFYLELDNYSVNSKRYLVDKIKFNVKKGLEESDEFVDILSEINKNKPENMDMFKLVNNSQNYISEYTKTSLDIAKYAIKNRENLLYSKKKVLENKDTVDFKMSLLVNGDSINKYTPKELK